MVMSAKTIMSLWLQSDLGIGIHVDTIATICKQRLYLLTQLKKDLSQSLLDVVLEAIVISPFTYAVPGCRGYASRAYIDLIKKLLVNARRWELQNTDYNVKELPNNCGKDLFVAS